MTPGTFRKVLFRLILVPVAALTALVGILLLQIYSLRQSELQVDRTDLTIAQTREVSLYLIDQETGLRGYLVTGEVQFLEPYALGRDQLPGALSHLQSLVSDDPPEERRVREIRLQYSEWVDFSTARMQPGRPRENLVAAAEQSSQMMDHLRLLVQNVLVSEEESGVTRQAHAVSVLHRTFFVLPLFGIIAAALIIWASLRQVRGLSSAYNRRLNEIQQEREWLNTTLRSIGDGVIACNAEGRLTLLNGVAEQLTGWTSAEALGRPIGEILHIVDEITGNEAENPIEIVRRTGFVAGLANNTLLIRKDGASIPIADSAAPIRDREGNLAGAVLVFRDVAVKRESDRELAKLNAALIESEAEARVWADELSTVLEVAPGIILIAHDPECTNVSSSTMSRSFLRLGEGRSPSKSIPPEFGPDHYRIMKDGREVPTDELPLERAARGQEQRNVELTLEFDDGSTRQIYGNAAPLFDADGAPRGAVAVFIDVTPQRNAAEALRRAEKIAVAGRLAASIAHEINNPLEAMTNLLYLAAHASDLEQSRQFTNSAQEQLRRASAIVTQTLKFHRESTRAAEISIPDVLESVLALWQRRFEAKDIAIVREFAPTPRLSGYEGELRQAFANLIGNAFEASSANGRVIVRTRAAAYPRDNAAGIRITIADTGSGMDRPTLRRVFEPFFTTKSTGTGLGMWITAEIVDKHGGSLHVRSRRAHPSGTVVSVFLPLLPPPGEVAQSRSADNARAGNGVQTT